MKVFTLKDGKAYPEVEAVVTGNNFGDQLVRICRENPDGSRTDLANLVNHEGEHMTEKQIKAFYRSLKLEQ